MAELVESSQHNFLIAHVNAGSGTNHNEMTFLPTKIKQPECESNYSSASAAKVKNKWSHNPISPYVFI